MHCVIKINSNCIENVYRYSDTLFMSKKFRLPSEMQPESDKVPISARIKSESRKTLQEEAKRNKLSLSLLVSNILEDYVDWLESQAKR